MQTHDNLGSPPHPTSRPILVIDDDPALRSMVRATLEADGYRVVTAASSREALKCLTAERPAVIILDLNLGLFAGEVVAAGLELDYGGHVPIVVISGDLQVNERTRGLPGLVTCLRKPFDLDELSAAVSDLVQAQRTLPARTR